MKILDLLERQIDTKNEPEGKFNGRFRGGHGRYAENTGYYSSVRGDRTDPHLIVKHTKRPILEDPYTDYVQYLIQHDLIDSNIHFPRIYNVREIQDKTGQKIYKYKMERLETMADLPTEIQETVMRENFTTDDFTGWDGALPRLAAKIMTEAVRGSEEYREIVKPNSLKKALSTLNQLYRAKHWTIDLHSKNFMIRRTPNGFQIVLTDPFG